MSTDNPVVEPVDKFYPKAAEPEQKPTEPAAVTEVVDQVPPEGSEKLDKPVEPVEKLEPAEESNATDDEETAQYLDLDGKEHNLEDVRKWRDGHMMQKDYTKKTQTLADDRRDMEAERDSGRENLTKTQTEVTEKLDLLTVLVAEDEAIDWVELKEKDLETYVELKEKADKRREALDEIKANRQAPADDPAFIVQEQTKLFAANPDWFDDDKKPTDTYKQDIASMNKYATNAGFSLEEFKRMTSAHHLITILKAAKFDELQEKGRKIKAKRDKVPIVTKPKAATPSSQPKSAVDIMYPPVEKTG